MIKRLPYYLLVGWSIFFTLATGGLMIDNYVVRVDQEAKVKRIEELKVELKNWQQIVINQLRK